MTAAEQAKRYAKRGWPVFPCNGKVPVTAHGLKDATTDRDQIEAMWRGRPDASVAICTGFGSGLVVLDVDGEEGSEALRQLEREHEELPQTRSVVTPSRGQHFYFQYPGGLIGNSVGKLGAGLDVRSDGGYVIAPPSPGYELDEQGPVADLPEWLMALMIREPSANGTSPKTDEEIIPAGKRNATLTSLAGTMRRRGMGEAEIIGAIGVTNETRCRPPLPGSEVKGIAASVGRYEPEQKAEAANLLIDMEAAMKLAEVPIAYAIKPIAARGFLTVLAGRHSSYKSWLMMITGNVSHRGGGEVAGLVCEATKVLYVDAENGPRLMGRRFRDAGIPADGLVVADGAKIRLPRDLGRLRELIEGTGGTGLLVLDSLRRLAPGIRENESDDMAALLADLAAIARDLDVAIVLIHHRSTKANAATLRGSSSIEDQADLVFVLERVTGDPDRQRRRLRAVKYRIDAEPPPTWMRFGGSGSGLTFTAGERHEGSEDDGGDGADEQLAERIDALAPQVRQDAGWSPSRLAAAVGSDQRTGTFQRAVKMLLERGTWQSEGSTRSRRLRPSGDSRHSRHSLGVGANGANENGEEGR